MVLLRKNDKLIYLLCETTVMHKLLAKILLQYKLEKNLSITKLESGSETYILEKYLFFLFRRALEFLSMFFMKFGDFEMI